MNLANSKILMLIDHTPDPRLRRRIGWLESKGAEVILSAHGRAEWLGKEGFSANHRTIPYGENQTLAEFTGGLVYVSGAKVLLEKRKVLSLLRKRNRVVVEVPDLPLRSRFAIINTLILWGFRGALRRVADALVVTSDAFLPHLPKGMPFLVSENMPDVGIADRLIQIPPPCQTARPVRIAFIGAVRYLEQIGLVLRFAADHEGLVKIVIHGGPISQIHKLLQSKLGLPPEVVPPFLEIHGPFEFERDGPELYASCDLVYAVYDARQMNVRLALPNKLYEAVLAGRPILCAENTHLARKAEALQIGFSLPSREAEQANFSRQLGQILNNLPNWQLKQEQRQRMLADLVSLPQAFLQFLEKLEPPPPLSSDFGGAQCDL